MIRKTKIVATIGPSSSSKTILKKMIVSGVNVCRINFSHTNHEEARNIISTVKTINQELHVHTAILADLQGPKIRVGNIEEPIKVKKGEEVVFSTKKEPNTIFINYSGFSNDVKKGDVVLLDDGKITFQVQRKTKTKVVLKTTHGGTIYPNKGVNLPTTQTKLPSLTTKDKNDLKFILTQKIEWIGLSFVRSSKDIDSLKKILKKKKSNIRIIAKIEKPEALNEIDEIIKSSDAVMVARGDLGVEISLHKVPIYQKMIVRKCMKESKPVVIATQMLESMTHNVSATRAEVNDVANSVIDGADAMMLSGETAIGKHPVKTIETMRKIIRDVEKSEHNISKNIEKKELVKHERMMSDAICSNACETSEKTKSKAIITITYSGYNTIKTSSFRPNAFIYAFTNNHSILNTLSLVWGVRGFYFDRGATTNQTIEETKENLKKLGLLKKGDTVVNIASIPASEKGKTNMMKLSTIK